MIGNDIVDLGFAKEESNWKQSRFLDKIFTQKEQKYIRDSQKPESMVWLLWSMKESAYKLYVQINGKRFFAPKSLVCTLLDLNEKESFGEVVCDDFQCVTQSEIAEQFIYTISKIDVDSEYLSQIFTIENSKYNSQHKVVYEKAIAQFAAFSEDTIQNISIQKDDEGIPFFYSKKQKQKAAVSMTHHGNYGAFAIKTFSKSN